jgi:hypothetical protein
MWLGNKKAQARNPLQTRPAARRNVEGQYSSGTLRHAKVRNAALPVKRTYIR